MIAPMVVAHRDVHIHKWLVLRKGYSPTVLTNERSSIYYTGGPPVTTEREKTAPFHLSPGGDASRRRIIDALSASPPDKRSVGIIFDSDVDVVRMSNADRDLIRLQL